MSDAKSIVVHLLDKEFRVACPPEEQENLSRAARYLDEKMREVRAANVLGLERIAVMTALNLAHDLLLAQGQLDQAGQEDGRIGRLLARVEAEIDSLRENAL